MKHSLVFIILFTALNVHAVGSKEVIVSPYYSYGRVNFYGQTKVPTYTGSGYGLELEYKLMFEQIGFAAWGSYSLGAYENSNNDSNQKEDLSTKYKLAGLKIYYNNLFFKAGYGRVDLEDKSEGTITKSLSIGQSLTNLGIGASFKLSEFTKIYIAFDANYSKFTPEENGVSKRTDFVNYNGIVGISIVIPSTPTHSGPK